MSSNILQKDWYEILGSDPSDSPLELRQNYQRLILLYHPDKQSADVPAGELEERAQRFIEVDQAWKILGNEETKREYDLQRRAWFSPHYLESMEFWKITSSAFPISIATIFKTLGCRSSEVALIQKWPVDAQVPLEDMNWIEADRSYTYSCRCGGEYVLPVEEAEENLFLVCCNTCSLSIEILNRS
ncbi:dnaJ homolog subfamily C member 24 isoform X1 [Pristis pectinata]|uniref:dnaJ homolog subfamily C member 24 isoform X1 n=1 Tax=Pristis pectinata TaxID=685728 RepID=UPI00223E5D08|nr:dnaJ homolog subfamily C member 24 isoform X1 [Pristis pectinata]XP_051885157.1 dnaJ homolog subfamily C member 24 isoform X1 [Pristis pectinata]XP_051885158.1 dnaJ homolog subfamily C member 24 isoform X1 [Pristis pectinata]XP_051885159.1 dnaJ homolog subfamily C member 24 isoform X1 [Pristis pectinata]XP_051885160.1 dnaJ homolog subfamily C member 24 isoform X1 [Pristis pectinata]